MSAQAATEIQLLIGDGASPIESFTLLNGVQITQMQVDHEPLNKRSIRQNQWLERAPSAQAQMILSGEGVYTASASEQALQQMAFSPISRHFTLRFGSGDELQGAFVMRRFERFGEMGQVVRYRFTLHSAGAIALS